MQTKGSLMDRIWLWQCKVETTKSALMTSTCHLVAAQMANHLVSVVHVEVKQEAGHSGDAQQEGMAFLLRDHATEELEFEFMSSWQTLRPALLLTVSQML